MSILVPGSVAGRIHVVQPSGLPPQRVIIPINDEFISLSCDIDQSTERDELSVLSVDLSSEFTPHLDRPSIEGGVISDVGEIFPPSEFKQVRIGLKVMFVDESDARQLVILCGAAPYSIALFTEGQWFGEPQFDIEECQLVGSNLDGKSAP